MKKFFPNLLGIIALAIVLNVALWPSTKPLWAQASVSIYGTTDGGTSRVPIYAGTDGSLRTTYSGTQSTIPVTQFAWLPYSSVSLTSGVQSQLLPADTARTALCIQNQSTAFSFLVGPVSPVTATNSLQIPPFPGAYCPDRNIPTSALFATGLSTPTATVVNIGVGR